MTYDLYIGDRLFSSWSMRGWMMLDRWGLPYRTTLVGLYAGTLARDLAHLAPAATVPVLRTPEGWVLTDSLAMAETLVERHPTLDLYPQDGAARAFARSVTAEMHSGFMALRSACPNQLSHVWQGFTCDAAVRADLDRITTLWRIGRDRFGGPWICGAYSLADVFYAPVAARITGYGLPVDEESASYVSAHLQDASFRTWRTAALTEKHDPFPYPQPLPRKPWPGDA